MVSVVTMTCMTRCEGYVPQHCVESLGCSCALQASQQAVNSCAAAMECRTSRELECSAALWQARLAVGQLAEPQGIMQQDIMSPKSGALASCLSTA